MILHPPLSSPDILIIIIGVLLADGILYMLRAVFHYVSRRRHNQLVAQRVSDMRPAALDQYRLKQERDPHAPLG